MPELRLDITTDEWVVIAPARSKRPHAPAPVHDGEGGASGPAQCPFCPGNEQLTPPEIERFRLPESCGRPWDVRVVPNRFAAFQASSAAGAPAGEAAAFLTHPAEGAHEVIIESPRHDERLADMSDEQVTLVFAAYQRRCRAVRALPSVRALMLFHNEGARGGASLSHSHTQIVGMPIVPSLFERRRRVACEHRRLHGECVHCGLRDRERAAGVRVIFESRHFVAIHPFAARWPYEAWLMPLEHQPDFAAISDVARDDAAVATRRMLRSLRTVLGNCPYNLALHLGASSDNEADATCWYLQIVPRLTVTAGFEIGTGMVINPALPEESAAALRQGGDGCDERRDRREETPPPKHPIR